MLEIILDLPSIHKKVLAIILELHNKESEINSKKIFEIYDGTRFFKKLNYSRISQIITSLQKEKIIYVKGSNGNNLRKLSIGENVEEIKKGLLESGQTLDGEF